jgi:plastocyanin
MRKLWFGLMCVGGVVLACSSEPTGNGSGCGGNYTSGVTIISAADNYTFSPANASAALGQSICFQNKGTILHDIVGDSVNPGDSAWAHGPEHALAPGLPVILGLGVGDYYYHCKIHGGNPVAQTGMWGKISVR